MREDRGDARETALRCEWSSIYRPEWDESAQEYIAAGLVAWRRARRLARLNDPTVRFTAYLGVQHFDPALWHLPGEPTTRFFASFLVVGQSAELRTFASMCDALAAVRAFHAHLVRLAESVPGKGAERE